MAIISQIGRRSLKVRALFFGMYAFLIVGTVTMIYPFMLMISGSTKSAVDTKYFDPVPRFLFDDVWLYRKHVEGLFNESVLEYDQVYGVNVASFENVEPPAKINEKLVAEWARFLDENTAIPPYSFQCGYIYAGVSGTIPMHLRGFKEFLREKYGNGIEDINKSLGVEFIGWNTVHLVPVQYVTRRQKPVDIPFMNTFDEYKQGEPLGMRYYFSLEGFYRKMVLQTQYSEDVQKYNEAHGTEYDSYAEVHLSRKYDDNGTDLEKEDWEIFVRDTLGLQWIRADESALEAYHEFLQSKHRSIETLNRHYGTQYASFSDIPLLVEMPFEGMVVSDWDAFIIGWRDPDTGVIHKAPIESLRIHSVEFMFRDNLAKKYGDIDAVNRALGTDYSGFIDVAMPQADVHYGYFVENKAALRREFATRNYKAVAEYLLLHGRGIFNTAVYCGLAVLLALLVNPVAAYAMSRYKMPSTYKILLFLMCTMAFPAMVTQIPNFLMLRQLGLLNTFAALLLPGMANGYSIFLLKGFFDSLPRELYESASLDGAGEWVMFWQVTMSLSKPILAVIALSAFTAAYSNFMFAFVVCQDERMWTLMVWLYQLQQRSGQSVVYASLIIAAVPTLLIFLFCQNIIMRGIVVPSEK